MSRVPDPIETQLRSDRRSRDPFADSGGLAVLLGVLFVDAFFLIAGWGASAASRQLLTAIIVINVLCLIGWVVAIPIRRWLYRPPK